MQTLPQTETAVERISDRDQYRAELAQELAAELREAAENAETFDNVLEQLVWLSDEQKDRAHLLIARADYRALGKLLCDVHEQLVEARLKKVNPKRVVLWDEGH